MCQAYCESWKYNFSAGRDDCNREQIARVSVARLDMKEAGDETGSDVQESDTRLARRGYPGMDGEAR